MHAVAALKFGNRFGRILEHEGDDLCKGPVIGMLLAEPFNITRESGGELDFEPSHGYDSYAASRSSRAEEYERPVPPLEMISRASLMLAKLSSLGSSPS